MTANSSSTIILRVAAYSFIAVVLVWLTACGNQDTASIPTTPPPVTTPPPATPDPGGTPTPDPSGPLPIGEVPSTVGGTGSISVSPAGGSIETAEDIDDILDAFPATLTPQPNFQLSGPIRLPNGSVPVGTDFYIAAITQGPAAGLDLNEPVEDVCGPPPASPIPPGGTCDFNDDVPTNFPGTFTLVFTFTDGAGFEYESERTVVIAF